MYRYFIVEFTFFFFKLNALYTRCPLLDSKKDQGANTKWTYVLGSGKGTPFGCLILHSGHPCTSPCPCRTRRISAWPAQWTWNGIRARTILSLPAFPPWQFVQLSLNLYVQGGGVEEREGEGEENGRGCGQTNNFRLQLHLWMFPSNHFYPGEHTHTHTMPFGTRGPLPKMGFSLRGCDFSGWDLRIGTPEHSRVLCTQDKPTSVNFNEVSKWEVHHHQQ